MAVWQQLVQDLLLSDGKIDDAEVKILRKHLYADGKIDKKEVEFLINLRNTLQKKAKRVNPAFEKFFFKAVQENVLADGSITSREARWLREALYNDKRIDPGEKAFLKRLK